MTQQQPAGLHESYFDAIALLAEDSLVPCEAGYAIRGLGKLLDPTSASADLRKDSRVDLPLWLAKALTQRHFTTMDTPAEYGEWMQRRVDAGASCVSLKKYPHFYTVGMQCADLTQDAALAAFLRKTFSERSQQLLSGSLKAPDGAALQRVLAKLDDEEKSLYEAGRLGAAAQERWWAAGGHTALLLASSVAAKAGAVGVKRRRARTEAADEKENQQG